MTRLIDAFPSLVRQLSEALASAGYDMLAVQVNEALIEEVTFDNQANVAWINVLPSRELNVVETNVIGIRHGKTIPVETDFWTNIDVDNFDRLIAIEILDPRELREELRNWAGG
jgi:hypothetical protein